MCIDTERLGVITGKRGRYRLPELRARLERIRSISPVARRLAARENCRHEAGCRARDRPKKESEIELVHHQRLCRQTSLVALCQTVGKARPPCRTDARNIPPPDEMRPERYVGARNVSPGDVQSLVPVVQRLVIRAFEARPTQPERLHVVAR